jgi:hypothetical protein
MRQRSRRDHEILLAIRHAAVILAACQLAGVGGARRASTRFPMRTKGDRSPDFKNAKILRMRPKNLAHGPFAEFYPKFLQRRGIELPKFHKFWGCAEKKSTPALPRRHYPVFL